MSQIVPKVTAELLAELKDLASKSTQVVGWYPHGYDRTVQGPFCRWFTCSEVLPEYEKHVGSVENDVRYCAAAMNAVPALVGYIEELKALLEKRK